MSCKHTTVEEINMNMLRCKQCKVYIEKSKYKKNKEKEVKK